LFRDAEYILSSSPSTPNTQHTTNNLNLDAHRIK
jgi:hypothetical protein